MSHAHFGGGLKLLLAGEDTAPPTTWASWDPRKSSGGRTNASAPPVRIPPVGIMPLISQSPADLKADLKCKQTGGQGHAGGEPTWCRRSYACSQRELTRWWDLEQVIQMLQVSVFPPEQWEK